MQITESSALGFRAVIYTLVHPDEPLSYMILPTTGIGTSDYFNQLTDYCSQCDIVMCDPSDADPDRYFPRLERFLWDRPNLNLVSQVAMPVNRLGPRLRPIPHWRTDPKDSWPERISYSINVIGAVICFYILWKRIDSRSKIAKLLAYDDLSGRKEILRKPLFRNYFEREAKLRRWEIVNGIVSHRKKDPNRSQLVGLMFSPEQMRPILRLLLGKLRYRIGKAEWLTVFEA